MSATKKLHTNSPIIFDNALVYYAVLNKDDATNSNFLTVIRKLYKTIDGTWGYSNITTQGHILAFSNLASPIKFSSSFYLFVLDEADALVINLISDISLKRASIIPSDTKFTIHEYIRST